MRTVHAIRIFIVMIGLSIGLVACAGRPADKLAPAPASTERATVSVPVPAALELADLKPVGEACGGIICAPSLHCCNPTCSLCTPKGVQCTQQTCN
jgi:hypothetical protein